MKLINTLSFLGLLTLTQCALKPVQPLTMQTTNYGKVPSAKSNASLISITNSQGTEATFTNFGAILISLKTADRNGKIEDITHGFDTLNGWIKQDSYKGATVGRYANRIAKGKFSLDGKTYSLATNNDPNHLHGGKKGFDKKLYTAETFSNRNESGVIFTRVSPSGEEGYPGNLTTTITYTLNNDNELKVEMEASTDQATIVNIAHHSYWNLSGDPKSTILDHELTLHANHYLPVDKTLIPTGELRPVSGTPFDFTKSKKIGRDIGVKNTQLDYGKGYDHCWVINGSPNRMRKVAELYDEKSGRMMTIEANQPGVQLYTGNFLDGSIIGKDNTPYRFRTALCLETQLFPDSPNQSKFQSPVLRPGQKYHHVMVHKFTTK